MGEFDLRGAELKKLLKIARKQPIAFAYNPGTSPAEDYFGLDRRKPVKTVFKKTKEEGPGKKVAFGTAHVEGRVLCLTCERELPSLAKKLKKYLVLEKVKLNIRIVGPDGTVLEEDIEDLGEDDDDLDDIAADEEPPADAVTAPAEHAARPENQVSQLESLVATHGDLALRIEAARAGDAKLSGKIDILSEKFLGAAEQGRTGVAKQFLDMLTLELNKVPSETSAAPAAPDPVAPDPLAPETAPSPLDALAETHEGLGRWIEVACASDDRLAGQVTRLSDKLRAAIEQGKEGMAKQMLDMLMVELKKVSEPAPDAAAAAPEPAPADSLADPASNTETNARPPAADAPDSTDEETSPIAALESRFTALAAWIDAARASDEKLARQVDRLTGKLHDALSRGKEGMAKQFMDMLAAELKKVPEPETDPTSGTQEKSGSDQTESDIVQTAPSDALTDDDLQIGDVIVKIRAFVDDTAEAIEKRAKTLKTLLSKKAEIAETVQTHEEIRGYLADICQTCVDAADNSDFKAAEAKVAQLDHTLAAIKAPPMSDDEIEERVNAALPSAAGAHEEHAQLAAFLEPVLTTEHPARPAVEKAFQSYAEAEACNDVKGMLSAIGELRCFEATIEDIGPKMGETGLVASVLSPDTAEQFASLLAGKAAK